MLRFWELKTKNKLLQLFHLWQKGHCYLYKLCFKGQQIIHSHPWIIKENNVFQSLSILPLVPIISLIWKPLKHLLNTSSYPTRRMKWKSLPYYNTKRWSSLLITSQSTKINFLWIGWSKNSQVCASFSSQQISQMCFSLLMLFSNTCSSMHSRRSFTHGHVQ
jgi:hypothetical protein